MEIFGDDLKIEIISKLRYIDILELGQVSKKYQSLCQNNILWNKIIKRDFRFYHYDGINGMKIYKYWNEFFDEYAIMIIKYFALGKMRYDKFEQIYEKIFTLLVEYISNIDAKEKQQRVQNRQLYELSVIERQMNKKDLQFEYYIFHDIFKICNIKMGEHLNWIILPPSVLTGQTIGQHYARNDLDTSAWVLLRQYIYRMINDYEEPVQ